MVFSFGGTLFLHQASLVSFDWLGLILFYGLGILLRRRDRDGLKLILPVSLLFFAIGIASILSAWGWLGMSFHEFSRTQIKAALMPYFFHVETLGSAELDWFHSVLKNIYAEGLVGWWTTVGGLGIYLNFVVVRFVESLDEGKPVSGWESLQKWTCPTGALLALVLSLALAILAVEGARLGLSEGALLWVRPVAWTSLILSGFPIFLQGLGLVAFILPRLGFFLLFLTLFVFFFLNPVLVLVLAGLIDLWFDLRSRVPERRDDV